MFKLTHYPNHASRFTRCFFPSLQPFSQGGVAKGSGLHPLLPSPQAPWERRHLAGIRKCRPADGRKAVPRNGASATPTAWKAALPASVFCDFLGKRGAFVTPSGKEGPYWKNPVGLDNFREDFLSVK